ncbi:hypothetical protein MyNCGM683_15560 [Achromobacter xylosoxidans]
MRSRESLRQLARLQSLGTVREQRAHAALRRAIVQRKELARRLRETEDAMTAIEQERLALFEEHGGLISRGGLFQLKRRESVLESRRINLMLDRTEIEIALAEANAAILRARDAVTLARRRRDKLAHVVKRFRQEVSVQDQVIEECEIEEQHYEH